MYLSPNSKNKPDSAVREVQLMLNMIREHNHHNWNFLVADGIYGRNSASAVHQFQIYRGISSENTQDGPVLGDTTVTYIRDEYYATSWQKTGQTVSKPSINSQLSSSIRPLADGIVDTISTFNDFVTKELTYVKGLRKSNPNALKQRYYSFVTRLDPRMKRLKEYLNAAFSDGKDSIRHNRNAGYNRRTLAKDLKRYDIAGKIKKYLADKGITGEIKLGKSPQSFKFQVKGCYILTVWNCKDLIFHLFKFREWGTEQWMTELRRLFFAFVDGWLIGVVSTIIAEITVGVTLAAVGASISVGWIIALIAIVAILLSTLISYLMEENVGSFSEMAVGGFYELYEAAKS